MEAKQYYPDELDLQKFWSLIRRRWLPATAVFGLVVALSAFAATRKDPEYEAVGRLLLKVDRQTALVGLLQAEDNRNQSVDRESSVLTTQAEVLRSAPVAQKVIDELQLKDDEGQPLQPGALLSSLTAKPIGGTDILQITYKSDDPEEAAAIVNAVATAYSQQSIDIKRQDAAEARKFIAEQLPKTEAAVREAEATLREFKESNGVVALEQEATSAVDVISNLQQQLTTAQAQLTDASARASILQGQLGLTPEQALVVASVSQAPGIQEVFTQLQTAQSNLEVQRTRYRDNHPAIASAQREVDALTSELNRRVGEVAGSTQGISQGDLQAGSVEQDLIANLIQAEAQRAGLENQVRTLSSAQQSYRERMGVLPRLEQTQRELERRLQAAQATYETLLTRLQEIQVSENQNTGNARLISPAEPPASPSSPGKGVYLLLGGVVGLLAGLATALMLDLVDRSLKTVKEARELFGYTLLGIIPSFSRDGRLRSNGDMERSIPRIIAQDCPHSPVAEAYQMLQANLKFLSSDREIKSLVITSSAPREGKSEVSANLAVAIAQVGHRVLLVDADMRHPSQHHAWDLTNGMGLSNALVDQLDFRTLVQRVMPNLDVLTAGVIPPNPVALLDSNRMSALIREFSDEYDYVLFDTPPLSGTADASVLGKMVDGMLLMVRPGVVNSRSAKATKDFLEQSGQDVLGIVVNGVDVRNEPDSYFYYSREYQGQRSLPASLGQSIERTLTAARDRSGDFRG
ncbi:MULTISPECIES: polysaccharide biosynthesis tyrosine autokinase [unclassified Leptolyngbya]|uniref:GumC family protein n=1 Tax=unclassified Leptolyngbya TaxID=2650499 RepID=UPI0016861146|nr:MULTISPECIES: polysaccharide biosynthesis tyrosine autokinase [unclassified Leptolyngbya]MBD1913273.1 polysaccharide biosynthesis tyrosine autokinase [Leptolyngbya sp. FACHB-8]MBD2153365.1 polysaccharide biosynthesis tyrosine autokinase [Leptolyngbya sp. FACHB-16]